jgi:putative salt-induced outer membrane protein
MKRTLLLTLLSVAPLALADQVTLSNGDRLTGTILHSDTKELVLKTEFAGTVTIAWSSVTNFTADGPIFVGLSDGQTVAGAVQAANGQVQVRTQTAGTVNAAQTAVQSLRNRDEQTAFETQVQRLRNPRLVDLWTGTLDLAFAATRGNAETQTFALSSKAQRVTNRDKIGVYYTSIFSSNSTTGLKTTTANSKRGGLTYDVNLNPKWFAWGSVELESDQFQSLDLRFVPAGGAGYHAFNLENTKLDLRGGASGNREFFSNGLNRSSAEVIIGEDFSHKVNSTTTLQESMRFFPNVSNSGAYRLNFDTTLATAFARWFSLEFTVSDRYLSNPLPGRKNNDVLFSTGVRLSFKP